MILVALMIGVILIVAALRNSQGALFSALSTDVPEYVIWAAAILAIGAIGFIPGLKPVSRGLLALIVVVIVLNNYQAILAGFKSVASGQTRSSGKTVSIGNASASSPTAGLTLTPALQSIYGGLDMSAFSAASGAQ